jgi:FAD:protein FMN transferase
MATRCHIVLPDIEDTAGDRIAGRIMREIRRIESLLSAFIPESDIARINRNAFEAPCAVSGEVFSILQSCKAYWTATNGAFDITLRPLYDYWKKMRGEGQPGTIPEELLSSLGMDRVLLDDGNGTVSFSNRLLQIDLGGIGKGYALQKADELLRQNRIENVFISFGESSILTRGAQPGGDCWKLGVNDILHPGTPLFEFRVRNGSMSTSGNFYVDDDGNLQNRLHVIDPGSGRPVERREIVSVSCASPVVAEVLSTSLLVSSDDAVSAVATGVRATASRTDIENLRAIRIRYSGESADVADLTPALSEGMEFRADSSENKYQTYAT